LYITLNFVRLYKVKYSYMFRPYCRAIFRLIFEQVRFTTDNDFDLLDLVDRKRPLRWLNHRSGRQPKTYVKPEDAIAVFEPLMMGGVSLETC
jgi:hypothetical protein